MNTGLLLIEGLAGSGKSTTAQWLNLHFNRHGRDAEWVFEHDPEHPIVNDKKIQNLRAQVSTDNVLSGSSKGQKNESVDVFSGAIIRWKNFARSLIESNTVVIVESALFQASIGSMLMMGWQTKDILAYVSAVDHVINPAQRICNASPQLLLFDPVDLKADLQCMAEKRGDSFVCFLIDKISHSNWCVREGWAEKPNWSMVECFFEDYYALVNKSLPLLSFDVLRIKKEGMDTDWSKINAEICEWLSLPVVQNPFAQPSNPHRYIGCYQDSISGDKLCFGVNETGLYIEDDFNSALIHIEDHRFLISGMPVECEFCLSAQNLILHSNLPGLAKVWEKCT